MSNIFEGVSDVPKLMERLDQYVTIDSQLYKSLIIIN